MRGATLVKATSALVRVVLLAACCAVPALAQQTTGNVRGVVADPNGAAVPNARLTITSKQTNVSQNAQTNDSGEYQFNNLLTGDYTVTVEAANFKTTTLSDVRVQLNQTTDLPVQLQLGLQGETVEVSAAGRRAGQHDRQHAGQVVWRATGRRAGHH